jgi:hypothetical protein
MFHVLVNWLLSAVSLAIVAAIVPGIEIAGFGRGSACFIWQCAAASTISNERTDVDRSRIGVTVFPAAAGKPLFCARCRRLNSCGG